jgi:SAM-dependent methyltransferase
MAMKTLSAPEHAQKRKDYLTNYERIFEGLASKDIRLLELGVWEGGSLAMWENYFPRGVIVGLDLRQSVLKFGTDRVKVYCGRQEDTQLLNHIASETAPSGFDIIIDDCSHVGELSRVSFWHLFENHLKPGGIYVIEDWYTGFMPKWVDGKALRKDFRRAPASIRRAIKKSLEMAVSVKPLRELGRRREGVKLLPSWALFHQKLPSHSYGMVGFVKQLMDEFGAEPSGLDVPTWFERMEVYPHQVFVYKKKRLD